MTITRIARIAALLAVLLWAAKALSTALAGGPGNTVLEEVFFLVGLVCALVAGGALALSYASARTLPARIGVLVAGLVALLAVAGTSIVLVELVRTSDHWLWGEVNLWVSALVALGVAWGPKRVGRDRQSTGIRPTASTTS